MQKLHKQIVLSLMGHPLITLIIMSYILFELASTCFRCCTVIDYMTCFGGTRMQRFQATYQFCYVYFCRRASASYRLTSVSTILLYA